MIQEINDVCLEKKWHRWYFLVDVFNGALGYLDWLEYVNKFLLSGDNPSTYTTQIVKNLSSNICNDDLVSKMSIFRKI